jgi:hypothetical protein
LLENHRPTWGAFIYNSSATTCVVKVLGAPNNLPPDQLEAAVAAALLLHGFTKPTKIVAGKRDDVSILFDQAHSLPVRDKIKALKSVLIINSVECRLAIMSEALEGYLYLVPTTEFSKTDNWRQSTATLWEQVLRHIGVTKGEPTCVLPRWSSGLLKFYGVVIFDSQEDAVGNADTQIIPGCVYLRTRLPVSALHAPLLILTMVLTIIRTSMGRRRRAQKAAGNASHTPSEAP